MTGTAEPRRRTDVAFEKDRGVTHLSARRGVAKITVHVADPGEAMGGVFRALADARVNVYLIKIGGDRIEFALDSPHLKGALAVMEAERLRYSLARECALVSLVAPSMRDLSGVLWRFMGTLREAGTEVLELSDAYNAVSCLMPERQLEAAVEALARTFGVALSTVPDPLDPW